MEKLENLALFTYLKQIGPKKTAIKIQENLVIGHLLKENGLLGYEKIRKPYDLLKFLLRFPYEKREKIRKVLSNHLGVLFSNYIYWKCQHLYNNPVVNDVITFSFNFPYLLKSDINIFAVIQINSMEKLEKKIWEQLDYKCFVLAVDLPHNNYYIMQKIFNGNNKLIYYFINGKFKRNVYPHISFLVYCEK